MDATVGALLAVEGQCLTTAQQITMHNEVDERTPTAPLARFLARHVMDNGWHFEEGRQDQNNTGHCPCSQHEHWRMQVAHPDEYEAVRMAAAQGLNFAATHLGDVRHCSTSIADNTRQNLQHTGTFEQMVLHCAAYATPNNLHSHALNFYTYLLQRERLEVVPNQVVDHILAPSQDTPLPSKLRDGYTHSEVSALIRWSDDIFTQNAAQQALGWRWTSQIELNSPRTEANHMLHNIHNRLHWPCEACNNHGHKVASCHMVQRKRRADKVLHRQCKMHKARRQGVNDTLRALQHTAAEAETLQMIAVVHVENIDEYDCFPDPINT